MFLLFALINLFFDGVVDIRSSDLKIDIFSVSFQRVVKKKTNIQTLLLFTSLGDSIEEQKVSEFEWFRLSVIKLSFSIRKKNRPSLFFKHWKLKPNWKKNNRKRIDEKIDESNIPKTCGRIKSRSTMKFVVPYKTRPSFYRTERVLQSKFNVSISTLVLFYGKSTNLSETSKSSNRTIRAVTKSRFWQKD